MNTCVYMCVCLCVCAHAHNISVVLMFFCKLYDQILIADELGADIIVDEDGGDGCGQYPTAICNTGHTH